MNKKKFLAKLIAASVFLGGINFLPVPNFDAGNFQLSTVHAETKNYTASDTAMFDFGEDDEFIISTVKNVAKMRAIQAAKEKAGVYLTSYSKIVNGNLTDDDISVVTNNSAELLDVKYKKIPIQANDAKGNSTGKVGLLYEATVTVKIDTDELSKYIKMTPQERLKLVEQNKNLEKSNEKLDNDFEKLRRQSNNSGSSQIIIQLYKIENRFTAQQKLEEGNRLYYRRDYQGAISKYNEAVKLNPEYEEANSNREIAGDSSNNVGNLENVAEFKGHYYKVFNEGMTWTQAKKRCEDMGGHLVTITSKDEQEIVKNLVISNGTKGYYWMGSVMVSKNKFKWITGEIFSYSNWAGGQPDNAGGVENVATMWKAPGGFDGLWNDVYEFGNGINMPFYDIENSGFICEWDSYSAIR